MKNIIFVFSIFCVLILVPQRIFAADIPELKNVELKLKAKTRWYEEKTLFKGSPVIVSVLIVNESEINSNSEKVLVPLGTSEQPWHKGLSFILFKDKKPVGNIGIKSIERMNKDNHVLKGGRRIDALFVIAPEKTLELSDGNYRLDIVFDSTGQETKGIYPAKAQTSINFKIRAPRSKKEKSRTYVQVAEYYDFEGMLTEKAETLEKALGLNPSDKEINHALGYAYFRLGELEKSKKNFEIALEYYKKLPDDHTTSPPSQTAKMIEFHLKEINEKLGEQTNK